MFRHATLFLLTLVLGGAVALAGWWTLFLRERFGDNEAELRARVAEITALNQTVEAKNGEIAALDLRVQELDEENARLATANRLLKVDRRLAEIEVLSQEPAPDAPEQIVSRVRFTEVDEEGRPVGTPKEVEVRGKRIYVETLILKFDDEYVEAGDPIRGTSVCLFQRLFGEQQEPNEGTPLDSAGAQPPVYAGDDLQGAEIDSFWREFWELANDPESASARGVRAAHGDAPFIEGRVGKRYRLELRASDGLTIRPEP